MLPEYRPTDFRVFFFGDAKAAGFESVVYAFPVLKLSKAQPTRRPLQQTELRCVYEGFKKWVF
jgi:hypothetical protein